jgi:hypothetical protein
VTSPWLLYQCQRKFFTQEMLFTPAQVFIVMVEISPIYAFAERGPSFLIWQSIVRSLTHKPFASSDAGQLAKIAVMLKKPVLIWPDLSTINHTSANGAALPCVLERVTAFYTDDRVTLEWQIEFCLPNYQVLSKRGTLSEICTVFINFDGKRWQNSI